MDWQARFGNLGAIIALLVLLFAVVFGAIGRLDVMHACFFAALALARLL